MFYKILETFVTFLVWYSFFLIAFALGFYIMLRKDVKSANPKDPVDEEESKFFNNPWWSIIKTSTMFVGEIEFSDIPISTESSTWPLGYLCLLTFMADGRWDAKRKVMVNGDAKKNTFSEVLGEHRVLPV